MDKTKSKALQIVQSFYNGYGIREHLSFIEAILDGKDVIEVSKAIEVEGDNIEYVVNMTTKYMQDEFKAPEAKLQLIYEEIFG